MTLTTILTEEEIKQISHAIRPTTQTDRLRQMGFTVLIRPDNTPVVSRANFLKITGALSQEQALQDNEPDWGAI